MNMDDDFVTICLRVAKDERERERTSDVYLSAAGI